MTIITKHSIIIKKVPFLKKSPDCDDLLIDVQPSSSDSKAHRTPLPRRRRHSTVVVVCSIIALLASLVFCLFVAMEYYYYYYSNECPDELLQQQDLQQRAQRQQAPQEETPQQPLAQQQPPPQEPQPPPQLHYQGFCSIPLSKDMEMVEAPKMALQWKEAEALSSPRLDVQVVNMNELDDISEVLREMLDINIGDSLERIAVFNNGNSVNFLHDFDTNVTGIVDQDRCFTMDLDPEVVLAPQLFVVGLRQGDQFNVAQVHSSLRAIVPAVQNMTGIVRGLADKCDNKPTYKLVKDTKLVIRKRSVEAPHHYMHFAGCNVQKIQISNMNDLLAHERGRQPLV